VPLSELPRDRHEEVAIVLRDAFSAWPDSWRTLEAARAEVEHSLGEGRLSLVAQRDHEVVGWIGGISIYHGRVWELHPIAVRPDCQNCGIGRTLVLALEDEVRRRGAITVYLGTDDLQNLTSIGGTDLYPNVLGTLATIQNKQRHPFEFYLRLGYEVVGAVPDANGFGRHDIMMAKRVSLGDGAEA
jgi:aminoglycoside 6'-N-acetyltransferase I